MKFIRATRADLRSSANQNSLSSYYFFQLVDIDESLLEEIKARMGFTGEYANDPDAPRSLIEVLDCSSFSPQYIMDLTTELSKESGQFHLLHPELSGSSNFIEYLIPFNESIVVGEWLALTKEMRNKVNDSFYKHPTIEDFKKHLSSPDRLTGKAPVLSDFESNFIEDKFILEMKDEKHKSILEIKLWDFATLGSIPNKCILSIDSKFNQYCNELHSDNYSVSNSTAYRTAISEVISEFKLSPENPTL